MILVVHLGRLGKRRRAKGKVQNTQCSAALSREKQTKLAKDHDQVEETIRTGRKRHEQSREVSRNAKEDQPVNALLH